MKKLQILGLLLACVLFTGCVKYRITLTDGSHFTVLGKPKYIEDRQVYRYKSGGKEVYIPSGRVSSIAPTTESDGWSSPGSGGNSGDSYLPNQ